MGFSEGRRCRMKQPFPPREPEFEERLPRLEAEREAEIDELMDVVYGNAPMGDLSEFRKNGVRLGHA